MMNYAKDQAKLDRAVKKLNFSRNTLIGDGRYRNNDGYAITANRIMTSLENFCNMPSVMKHDLGEALSEGLWGAAGSRNFSRRRAFSNVVGQTDAVSDIDVVDISIATTMASHGLTYIAMERPMEAMGSLITFQGLKAVNDVGGFTSGQTVYDPRMAIDPQIDFGRGSAQLSGDCVILDDEITGTSGSEVVTSKAAVESTLSPVNLAYELIRGTTIVKLQGFTDTIGTDSSGTKIIVKGAPVATLDVVAFDTGREVEGVESLLLSKNGNVVASGNANLATGVVTLTKGGIDKTGLLALFGAAGANINRVVLHVESCADRIEESSGAHTMKLRPFVDSVSLQATENRIILQSNVEIQNQMNKIFRTNARYGIENDYGKRAIDQIVALYTYFIDKNIVSECWNGIDKDHPVTLDLSGFGSSSPATWGYNANVKNDALGRFTDQLCSKMLMATNQPVTALIVDDVAAQMYSSDKESFIPDPAFMQRRDGFVGTYKGIPVVRNYVLHGKGAETTVGSSGNRDKLGVVMGVFKSPDGQCAPVAFGDYLPPYSTLPALNPANPTELSQALFSCTATKAVAPGWSVLGLINPYGHDI